MHGMLIMSYVPWLQTCESSRCHDKDVQVGAHLQSSAETAQQTLWAQERQHMYQPPEGVTEAFLTHDYQGMAAMTHLALTVQTGRRRP